MPRGRGSMSSADRKRLTLDVALRLFAERGYDGTSLEDIGKAMNITGPAIYRHFGGKEQILIEAFEHAGRDMIDGFEASLSLPAADAADVLLRSHARMAVHEAGWIQVWLQERNRPGLAPQWGRSTKKVQRNYLSWWTEVVAHLRPDLTVPEHEEIVHAVIGLLNGAAFYRSALTEDARIDFLVDAANSVIYGTRKKATRTRDAREESRPTKARKSAPSRRS